MKLPVNADVLYTVFVKYGDIQRIVCFPRNLGYQALIEFKSLDNAKSAKRDLDGKPMYHSGTVNLLRI